MPCSLSCCISLLNCRVIVAFFQDCSGNPHAARRRCEILMCESHLRHKAWCRRPRYSDDYGSHGPRGSEYVHALRPGHRASKAGSRTVRIHTGRTQNRHTASCCCATIARKLLKGLVAGGDLNSRPWGYESQGSPCTSFLPSIKPIKQWVAVGKDAFMCFMLYAFRYESRQNLGKTSPRCEVESECLYGQRILSLNSTISLSAPQYSPVHLT